MLTLDDLVYQYRSNNCGPGPVEGPERNRAGLAAVLERLAVELKKHGADMSAEILRSIAREPEPTPEPDIEAAKAALADASDYIKSSGDFKAGAFSAIGRALDALNGRKR